MIKILPILLICYWLSSVNAFSQRSGVVQNNYRKGDTLTLKEFNIFLSQQFNDLITGKTNSNIGSSATTDLKDPVASISYSHIWADHSILNLKFTGGTSDGISSIFKNSEFNTDASIDLQYNFLRKRNQKIVFTKIPKGLDSTNVNITGFTISWFSFGYKLSRSSFKLFDPDKQLQNQITSNSFISHDIHIEYSRYKWSRRENESYFLNIGLEVSYLNNLQDLNKNEITDEKNYGLNPGERTSRKTYDAYSGEYKERILGSRVYFEFYRFFSKQSQIAIHLFPEFQTKEKSKPVTNVGIGFLFSFKNSKDEKSITNVEAYYNFLDLFKLTKNDYNLFKRNDIGLNFYFPVNFKTS